MVMPTRLILISLLLSLTPYRSLLSQDWPDPYKTPGTVGSYLESQFVRIMSECNIPRLRITTRWGGTKDKSSIPTLVRQSLPMGKQVLLRARESAARVFGYIQPTTSVDASQPDPSRYLRMNMDSDAVSMLATGFSSIAYTHTCSSVVSAGVQAGLSIPPVDVKSSLSADFANKTQTVLALVEGTFFSPISSLLNQGSEADQTYARLLFWEWYTRNPGGAISAQYYIKQFDGFTLYSLSKSRRDLNGKVDFSAGVAAPAVASINAMINAGIAISDVTDAKAFATGFYLEAPNRARVLTDTVPSPVLLATDLSKVRGAVTLVNTLVLQNTQNTHSVDILGMPGALCSTNAWVIDHQPTTGTLSLNSATEAKDSRSCRFEVGFVAAPSVFMVTNNNIAIQYSLLSKTAVGGNRINWAVGPINLTTSNSPVVVADQANPNWQMSTTTQGGLTDTALVWQVPFRVDDRLNPLQNGSTIGIRDATLTCDQGVVQVAVDPAIALLPDRREIITAVHKVFAGESIDVKLTPPRNCRFNATLDLTLVGGEIATRNLPTTQLYYPPRKQMAADSTGISKTPAITQVRP